MPCADAHVLCAPSALASRAARRCCRVCWRWWSAARATACSAWRLAWRTGGSPAQRQTTHAAAWCLLCASLPVARQVKELSRSQQFAHACSAAVRQLLSSTCFLDKLAMLMCFVITERGLRAVGAACLSSTACWALRRAPCLLRWTTARTTSLSATSNITWAALLPWNTLWCAPGLPGHLSKQNPGSLRTLPNV